MTRYVPIGPKKAGGIGSAVLYHDANLDRKVVIKFVLDQSDHRRHLDELAALQLIRSKHVVEVFDVIYHGPNHSMGIVEEFIDGVDLRTQVGTVQPDMHFLQLLFQMSSGLADIHAVDMIHRDIKPQNMMLTGDGILKIIDFNLSRRNAEGKTGGFVGTRGYAAPELYLEDENGLVAFGPAVDVYALAVTALALVLGTPLPADLSIQPPHPEAWVANDGFETILPGMDSSLVRVLDLCLDPNPQNRPSAKAIFERTERVMLREQHRAWFATEDGGTFELNAQKRAVKLRHPSGTSALTIAYDGLDFRLVDVIGDVRVNNIVVEKGATLSGSHVISLGTTNRKHVTMDVSHPEVVL